MIKMVKTRLATPIRAKAIVTLAVSATCIGGAATFASDIGFGDLVDRLGADQVPTGAGVNVSQTEVIAGGAYGPWQDDPEFSTITFTAMSGSPGVSGHATEVAKNFYGNTVSIAPGIPGVWLYEVNSFLNSYLRVGQGNSALPLVPPGGVRIFNHSWIGSAGSATDNDVNRRADFAMNRDDTLFIAGLNNTLGTPPPLMNSMFNGLSVGRADGVHSYGNVAAGDVPGRMKPEIVAPGSATSWTAPIVGSVAALLYETANTLPLSANPNARKGVVIKSAIMAGAHRRAGWTNNPVLSGPNRGVAAKPLDTIYGADVVNINRAHLILTAGEQEGSATVPSSPSIGARGWDYRSMLPNTTVYYRFTLTEAVEDVSILVTWNRAFGSTISAGIPGNLDLRLFKVLPGATDLLPLTGDAGIGVFDAGNVASLSTVDNVELLFLRDLAAGEYVIELKRVDAAGIAVQTALSWIMPETPETPPPVPGDVNGDGIVNGADIAIVLGSWGVCIGCAADLNGDGVVDGADLSVVLGNWSS